MFESSISDKDILFAPGEFGVGGFCVLGGHNSSSGVEGSDVSCGGDEGLWDDADSKSGTVEVSLE